MTEHINPNAQHIKWCKMKKENDEYLCATYPKIFRDRHANMQVTCMCWGFDVGDGWFKIIDELCKKIQDYVDSKNGAVGQIIASQVKEKFGSLRFYTQASNEDVDAMISEACHKCDHTCEVCGEPGNLYEEHHWYLTRCSTHASANARLIPENDPDDETPVTKMTVDQILKS